MRRDGRLFGRGVADDKGGAEEHPEDAAGPAAQPRSWLGAVLREKPARAGKAIVSRSPSSSIGRAASRQAATIAFSDRTCSTTAGQSVRSCSRSSSLSGAGAASGSACWSSSSGSTATAAAAATLAGAGADLAATGPSPARATAGCGASPPATVPAAPASGDAGALDPLELEPPSPASAPETLRSS